VSAGFHLHIGAGQTNQQVALLAVDLDLLDRDPGSLEAVGHARAQRFVDWARRGWR
jgi:hypothetical protein